MIRNWFLAILAGLAVAAIAWQGTLVATPYVLNFVALDKIGQGRVNSFNFTMPATSENQPIVRPSPDLSYATCVFDLSEGPVLLDVEPVPDHYWSITVFDGRTDVAAVQSDRDTGGKPARLVLLRDGMAAPSGYKAVTLGHDKGLALIRILMKDRSEFPVIDAIRRKSRCYLAPTK